MPFRSSSLLPTLPMAAGNRKCTANQVARYTDMPLTCHSFPPDFLWGAATSSYQIEGAYKQDHKSLSNWDMWTSQHPEKVADHSNGNVAIDHYNRVKEDVKIMKKLGLDTYRFSISWSRILPDGNLSGGGVNKDGVKFYNDLIDMLVDEKITPFVTLFHFDVPQCLMDEYGAFEDVTIVDDFGEYVEVCFHEFGDRVKNWITLNEACTYVGLGYIAGAFPPGHGSTLFQLGKNRQLGHRSTNGTDRTIYGGGDNKEPYNVAHNLLLSHARAVEIYRNKYQTVQGGKIGITNVSQWYDPYDPTDPDDVVAALRAVDFEWGWFTEPIITGEYPSSMRLRVGDRLPKFTEDEKKILINSFDFIGMNYYTTYLAQNDPTVIPPDEGSCTTDRGYVRHSEYPDGTPIGEQAGSTWLYKVPHGIYGLLKHNAKKYGNPDVYITENGWDEKNKDIPIREAVKDDSRIDYLKKHFEFLKQSIHDGVNLKGYMLWSLFDNFEWAEGYSVRFGIYYIDFKKGLTRYPKNSAIWYMNFLNKNRPAPSSKRRAIGKNEADNGPVKKTRFR